MKIQIDGCDIVDCLDKLSWANAYQAFWRPCPTCGRSGMTYEPGYNDDLPCVKCGGSGISNEVSEFGKALLEFIKKNAEGNVVMSWFKFDQNNSGGQWDSY